MIAGGGENVNMEFQHSVLKRALRWEADCPQVCKLTRR